MSVGSGPWSSEDLASAGHGRLTTDETNMADETTQPTDPQQQPAADQAAPQQPAAAEAQAPDAGAPEQAAVAAPQAPARQQVLRKHERNAFVIHEKIEEVQAVEQEDQDERSTERGRERATVTADAAMGVRHRSQGYSLSRTWPHP